MCDQCSVAGELGQKILGFDLKTVMLSSNAIRSDRQQRRVERMIIGKFTFAICRKTMVGAIFTLFAAFPFTWAYGANLPERITARPDTTDGVPHVQIGVSANPALSKALLERVAKFPGVALGATRVSLPGAIGFQLNPSVNLARPNSIVGGREFAHLHPDGSLHASLAPTLAQEAIAAGWAVAHPWSTRRAGWEGFVMIYTPSNQQELDVVYQLVRESFNYVTGQSLTE